MKDYRSAQFDFEQMYYVDVLRGSGGQITKAAEKAGIERSHFMRRMKKLGIVIPRQFERGPPLGYIQYRRPRGIILTECL